MKTLATLFLIILTVDAYSQAQPFQRSSRSIGARFAQRFPQDFFADGEDFQGRSCSVVLDMASRLSRAFVRTDFRIRVFDGSFETLAVFDGSWHTAGGRGGCATIQVDHPSYFYFRQDTGSGPPCFAHPGRLFHYSGDLKISKLEGDKILFEVQDDNQPRPTYCVVDNGNIFQ